VRVLLVEDDDRVAHALVPALVKRGLVVTRVAAGRGVPEKAGDFDVILLDLGLPDIDGMTLCRQIRAVSKVSIIVVSARGEVDDRILALRAGADDYLVKPYDVNELVARVDAVHRRSIDRGAPPSTGPITFGDVVIDLDRYEVRVAGNVAHVSRKEFQVLALIMAARGAVVPRDQILSEVWGHNGAAENRSLDVHVATLRTKLDRPALIETVRGVGYRLAGRPE
jgi:DNA-binding response OmpR family regulator